MISSLPFTFPWKNLQKPIANNNTMQLIVLKCTVFKIFLNIFMFHIFRKFAMNRIKPNKEQKAHLKKKILFSAPVDGLSSASVLEAQYFSILVVPGNVLSQTEILDVSGMFWSHFSSLKVLLSLGILLLSPSTSCLASHILSSWYFCCLVWLYLSPVMISSPCLLARYLVNWPVLAYLSAWTYIYKLSNITNDIWWY